MIIESMHSYRVTTPSRTRNRAGQANMPEAFTFQKGTEALELPWGTVVEARKGCKYPFEFSDNEQKYLAHVDFIKSHKNLFNPL